MTRTIKKMFGSSPDTDTAEQIGRWDRDPHYCAAMAEQDQRRKAEFAASRELSAIQEGGPARDEAIRNLLASGDETAARQLIRDNAENEVIATAKLDLCRRGVAAQEAVVHAAKEAAIASAAGKFWPHYVAAYSAHLDAFRAVLSTWAEIAKLDELYGAATDHALLDAIAPRITQFEPAHHQAIGSAKHCSEAFGTWLASQQR